MPLQLNQTELAAFFDVDVRTVRRWTKTGLPRDSSGEFPLAHCVAWVRERDRQEAERLQRPATEDEARARKVAAEAELAEYELAEKRQSMVSIDDHDRILGRLLDRLRAKILNIPGRWSPHMVGLRTISDGQLRLEELMQECLLELTRVGDEIEEDDETYRPQDPPEPAPVEPPARPARTPRRARARAAR